MKNVFFRTLYKVPIKLVVCDMSNTIINDGGIVYNILFNSIRQWGIDVLRSDIKKWHGISNIEIIKHYIKGKNRNVSFHDINMLFEYKLLEEYFNNKSKLSLIDSNLPMYFNKLRDKGIKVALNTVYSQSVQDIIVERLNLNKIVDTYTNAEIVGSGCPYPDMIYKIMNDLHIKNPEEICKIGGSKNDIYEGINAGCKIVVGIKNGVDNEDELKEAGANIILNKITDLHF